MKLEEESQPSIMEKAFGHLNTYFSRLKACLCFPIFQEFHETRFSEFKGFKKKGLSLKDSLIFIWKDESTKRKPFFPLGPIFRGFLVQTCTVIEKMFRTLSIYEAKENPRNLPFSAKGINPNIWPFFVGYKLSHYLFSLKGMPINCQKTSTKTAS